MQKINKEEAMRVARELSAESDSMVCVMHNPSKTPIPQVIQDEELHKYLVRHGWTHLAYFKNGARVR